MPLHESLRLYISPDSYALVGESDKPETLHIDRRTGKISLYPSATAPPKFEKDLLVYGLFGIIPLLESDYLILITKRTKIGRILSSPIYSATDFAVFPISRSPTTSLLAHANESYLLGLLKQHLFSAPFYFSFGPYDVTSRLQLQYQYLDEGVGGTSNNVGPLDGKGPGGKLALWERADERFFWNKYLVQSLIDLTNGNSEQNCSRFILPVMFGFLNLQRTTLSSQPLLFGLISRRSRHRAGTRYFSRGINSQGDVSNFNETEQILFLDSGNGGQGGEVRFSFVQTRGSVPIYWAEINNLRYKPDLKIMDLPNTADSLKLHFDSQVAHYGDQYLVNLVNKSGYEMPIKAAYEKGLSGLGNSRVHYTYFDFHHECKGLRFDRVSVLIDGLDEELHQQSYFYHDTTSSPARPQHTQTSVVRTNCMDCLDRTNVVQSALGKWVLNNQLRQAGVLSVKESIEEHPAFLRLFRSLWADNADVVSRAYSGTGALKTDYTRTGKRTKEGALQDGVNSIVRYVKNNFLDGPRQDSYDLVTGRWIPRKGMEPGWGRDGRDAVTKAAPYGLAFAMVVILLCFLTPALVHNYFLSIRRVLLIGLVVLVAALYHIMTNGVDYVAWPKLVVLDDVLAYHGKGYESGRRGRPLRAGRLPSSAPPGATLVPLDLMTKKVPTVLKKERKESVLPTSSGAGPKRD